MKKNSLQQYLKVLGICFIYYLVLQLVVTGQNTMHDLRLNSFNLLDNILGVLFVILLILPVILLVVFVFKTNKKFIKQSIVESIKCYWFIYIAIIFIAIMLSTNPFFNSNLGYKIEKSLVTTSKLPNFYFSFLLCNLLSNNFATIFFIFVPFICHVYIKVKQKTLLNKTK